MDAEEDDEAKDAVLGGGGHGGRGRTRWPAMRAHDEVDLDHEGVTRERGSVGKISAQGEWS